MKKVAGIAVFLAVLLQISSLSFAAAGDWVCPLDRKQAEAKMNSEHAKRVDAWAKVYKLSPEQKERVSNIMIKYRDKALDEKNKLIDSLVQAINDSDSEIKSVLTAAQIEKYETMKAQDHRDLGERMREWFNSGMCY